MKRAAIFLILMLALSLPLWAQPDQPAPPGQPAPPARPALAEPQQPPDVPESPAPPEPPDDPLRQNLFPPELIMRHQAEIGLSESQRNAIRQEVVKGQSKFLDLQWQMEGEKEKLEDLLKGTTVDENKALAQADKLMQMETDLKKSHLTMLIRIKNILNPEQKQKLMELRPPRLEPPKRKGR